MYRCPRIVILITQTPVHIDPGVYWIPGYIVSWKLNYPGVQVYRYPRIVIVITQTPVHLDPRVYCIIGYVYYRTGFSICNMFIISRVFVYRCPRIIIVLSRAPVHENPHDKKK